MLELSGAFQHDPARRRPVGPESSEPVGDPPAYLAEDEAACWWECCRDAPAGVLTGHDRWVLEMPARLVARSRRQGSALANQAVLRVEQSALEGHNLGQVMETTPHGARMKLISGCFCRHLST